MPTISPKDKIHANIEGPLRLVMCARDEHSKGWEIAIEAVVGLLEKGHKLSLDLIGNGPYIESLKQTHGASAALHFLGAHPNPMEILPNYDVGLLPTFFAAESLPNTVIEYQACGLAAISTRIGEIPNLIVAGDQSAGQLIEIGDKAQMIQSLQQCLRRYLVNATLLDRHKSAALKLRDRFNIRFTALQYLAFSEQFNR